jgi:hypothetical protein
LFSMSSAPLEREPQRKLNYPRKVELTADNAE